MPTQSSFSNSLTPHIMANPLNIGGIHGRKLEKLKQEAKRLGKAYFALAETSKNKRKHGADLYD